MKKYVFILLAAVLLTPACTKQDLTVLDEVIYVRNEGADMPAYVHGNGASKVFIVLLHGGPGGNSLDYRTGEYYKPLEEKYAVVYWDQRGQGAAHGHFGTDKLTIAQMVDDVRSLLLILKHKYGSDVKLFLFGHSWGGTLGTAFMVTGDNQELVDGWIEADGAHDIPLLNKEAVKMFISIGEQQINLGKHVDKWQKFVDFAYSVDTNNITTDDGDKVNDYGYQAEDLLDEVYPSTSEPEGGFNVIFRSPTNYITSGIAGSITANRLYDEIEHTSLTDQLSHITAPCLFIWGRYDFVVAPALGYDAYNRVSSTDKELVILEHAGHSSMDNQPDAFDQAVITFIEQHR